MNARKSPVFVSGHTCLCLHAIAVYISQQQSIGWYCVFFFCQVQEPEDEDEYEVCDNNDGAYVI